MRVTVDAVTKRYAEEGTLRGASGPAALDQVSLDVGDGETVSLVGPSGCGKSTLLRMVAGLDRPDGGRVLYNGHDMVDVSPQDRGIGMVFQDYALYPTMKGRGNLSYFFEVRQRTEAEAQQRAKEVAAIMGVGFELLLGQMPTTLSGGEKQRVAIARCIVRDPTLFLMDEPICNLDAKLRETTRMEVKKLLRRFGVTTLYVTHDQQEAVFMGDRIAVLRDGRAEQVGSFDDLYYSPANLFVATFLGSRPIAVLPVEIADRKVLADGVSWELPPELADTLAPGKVRLGVRPEGWLLGDEHGAGARLDVRRVERIPTEQATLLHGTLSGSTTAVTAVVIADTAPELAASVAAGATPTGPVGVRPDWERVSVFAAADETVLHTPGVPEFF